MVKKSKDQIQVSRDGKKIVYAVAAIVVITIAAVYFYFVSLNQPSPPNAAIVDQLSSLKLAESVRFVNQSFIDTTRGLLYTRFSSVDYYSDNATVEQYRQLASRGYRLIVWRAHSALDLDSKYVAISATDKYGSADYDEYLNNDQLTLCNVTGEASLDKMYLGITPKFIREVMEGRFDHTVIIMMSCNGLRSGYYETAHAFEEKGVEAFISWDEWVDSPDNDQATSVLLQFLLNENETVDAAVKRIPSYISRSGATVQLRYDPQSAANYRIPNYVQSEATHGTAIVAMNVLRKTGKSYGGVRNELGQGGSSASSTVLKLSNEAGS